MMGAQNAVVQVVEEASGDDLDTAIPTVQDIKRQCLRMMRIQ